MTIKRPGLRRLQKMHERKLKGYQRELQEIDHEIAERNRAPGDRVARIESINPHSIVVIFDTMHSTGFNFKNMPFWRTTLGFALGILASWSTVEMLRMSGFRPDGWPQWSLPAIYLFMTFVVTAVTSYMISHRYDYGICAKCGMRKNTWDSPLCGMCWDDYELQQVKEEVPKLIEKFIKEEQDRDKERESHPPKLVCMICKSRLHWDVSWDAYICSEHGDIKTQSHHSRKEFIKEQIQFLENLTHIS